MRHTMRHTGPREAQWLAAARTAIAAIPPGEHRGEAIVDINGERYLLLAEDTTADWADRYEGPGRAEYSVCAWPESAPEGIPDWSEELDGKGELVEAFGEKKDAE